MSGFIREKRSSIPKPKGTIGPTPPKRQSKPSAIHFTQEELSRRAKGSKILQRPVGPRVDNRA